MRVEQFWRLCAGVEAVVFDMDGTLVDSEVVTERAVRELLEARGLSAAQLDPKTLSGSTWQRIEALLAKRFPTLVGERLADALQMRFQQVLVDDFPPEVPGAVAALRAAARVLPVAITTSSNRESLDLLLDTLDLRAIVRVTICAEDCVRSKPDPQAYLLTATALGCTADRCLVFEDSLAGLAASRAARARTVAITRGKPLAISELADARIADFTELPADFFSHSAEPVRGATR